MVLCHYPLLGMKYYVHVQWQDIQLEISVLREKIMRIISKVIGFLLLFMMLFGPRLKLLDIMHATNIAFFFAFLFYIIFIKKRVEKPILVFFTLSLVAFLYSFFIVGINGFKDITIFKLLSFLFFYSGSAYLILLFYKNIYPDEFHYKVRSHIFISGVINGLFVIFVFVSNGFSQLFISILNYSDKQLAWTEMGRRSFDLNMGGGSGASVVFSFIFLIGLTLFKNNQHYLSKILGLVILFIATLLTGRTGLLFLIIYIPISILLINSMSSKSILKINIFRTVKLVIVTISILTAIFLFVSFGVSGELKEKYSANILPWAFEFYYSFKEEGSFSTESTDMIFNNMYFLPENITQLAFGNSNMGRTDNLEFIPSDVGYIRFIFGFGVLGMILIYLPLIYLGYFSYKNKEVGITPLILLFLIIGVFISNFKELDYMERGGGAIILLLFMTTVFQKYAYKAPLNKIGERSS